MFNSYRIVNFLKYFKRIDQNVIHKKLLNQFGIIIKTRKDIYNLDKWLKETYEQRTLFTYKQQRPAAQNKY